MYLFLNTAFSFTEIAVFSDSELFFSKRFESKNEVKDIAIILEKELFPRINSCQIKGILVSKGPGRFTSLRSGAMYAKTIAFLYHTPVHPFKTDMYIETLTPKAKALIQTGIQEVFFEGSIHHFSALSTDALLCSGEVKTPNLLPTEWTLVPIPAISHDALMALLEKVPAQKDFDLFYGKEPNITVK